MFHVDLYRLNDDPQEIESLGLDDLLDAGGVVVVEWGEKLPAHVREHAIAIRFHDMGEGSRKIEIDAGARNSAMASDA